MIPRGALEVILFADRKFVGSLMFSEPTITVGSHPSCLIVLEDATVAPEHAVVHFTGRTAIIEDHGGTSGVFVGGRPIDNHLIQAGDEIKIGRYGLRFIVHQVVQPAPPLPQIPQPAPPQPAPAPPAPAAKPSHYHPGPAAAPAPHLAPVHVLTPAPGPAPAPTAAALSQPAITPVVVPALPPVTVEDLPLPVAPAAAPVAPAALARTPPELLQSDTSALAKATSAITVRDLDQAAALATNPDLGRGATADTDPNPAPAPVARAPVEPAPSRGPVVATPVVQVPPSRGPVVVTPAVQVPPSRAPAAPSSAPPRPLFDPPLAPPADLVAPAAKAPPAARAPAAPAPPATSKAPPAPAPAPPATSKAPAAPAPPASRAPAAAPPATSRAPAAPAAPAPPAAARAPAAPSAPSLPPRAASPTPVPATPSSGARLNPGSSRGPVAPVQPSSAPRQPLPDLARGAAPDLPVDIGLADLFDPDAARPRAVPAGDAAPAPREAARPVQGEPAPPPRRDDDDEDDEPFVPSFSLLDAMREREVAGGRPQRAEEAVVQIVYCHDDFIVGLGHLAARRKLRLAGGTELDFAGPGKLNLRLAAGATAELHRPGEATPRYYIDSSGGDATVDIDLLSRAVVHLRDRESVLLQFVAASSVPRGSLAPSGPSRETLFVALGSAVAHVVAFVLLGLSPTSSTAAAEITQGRFAMIEMKDPILEVPKEKPKAKEKVKVREKVKVKQEVKAPPTPTPPTPQPPMPQLPESLRKFVSRAPRGTPGPVNPKASSTANKALAALGSLGGTSSTAMAVTNLDAVPATGTSGAGFQVSGAIGKMDGGLHLAPGGSGVGRVDTKGGAHFGTANSKVAGKIGGDVRGRVKQAPAREVEVQGELDRTLIAKVINSHIYEIQGCWERRLVASHGLTGGKLVLDWVIVPTGSVGMVRVKSNDIKDGALATCVQSAIRLWKFPSPKGGSVTVTYPFVFQQM